MGRVPRRRSTVWSRAVAAGDAPGLLAAETDGTGDDNKKKRARRAMRYRAALSTTALIFAAGCGARTVLDLADYTNGPTPDGGATGSGSGSGSGSSGSNGGSGGSSGGGSGGSSGSVGGSTSGGGSGGSSGGVAPISCGAQSCDPTSQECCVSLGGGGGAPMESCGPKGQCMGDVTLNCTGSSNCPNNEVCCLSTRGGMPQARCATRCRGGGGGGGPSGQLCSTNQDCPMGQQCMMTPFGLGVCLGGGGPGGGGGGGGGFGGGGGGPGGGGGGGGGGGTGGNPGGASSSSGG
jgi:hypothetical protein